MPFNFAFAKFAKMKGSIKGFTVSVSNVVCDIYSAPPPPLILWWWCNVMDPLSLSTCLEQGKGVK